MLINRIKTLIHHDVRNLQNFLFSNNYELFITNICIIIICGGMYACSVGIWRAPLQAVYVAIKFPLLILSTVLMNAMINWILSQILGLQMSLKQSVNLILYCFSTFTLILASFIPIILFIIWNIPSVACEKQHIGVSILTLFNVAFIVLAGILANIRLYYFLLQLSNKNKALIVLFVWLSCNLFLGAQISWNLRPFIGTPDLKIEFIREYAFYGTFYEDVYQKLNHILK